MALSWLRRWLKKSRPLSRSARRPTLAIEALEDRTVPSFLPPVTLPVGVDPRAVAVADFNHDGKPDLAVANAGPFSAPTSQSSVSVLLGNGGGSFRPAVTTAVLNGGAGNGNAQSVAVGPEIHGAVLGQARGEVVTRCGLRGIGTDERTQHDQERHGQEHCHAPAAHLAKF